MQYKEEMLINGDTLDGCAGLEGVSSFEEWIDFDNRLKKKYGEGYATIMLKQMLKICKEYEEEKVLLTCDKTNELPEKQSLKMAVYWKMK